MYFHLTKSVHHYLILNCYIFILKKYSIFSDVWWDFLRARASVIWFPHISQLVTAAHVVQRNVTATQDSVIVMTMLLARSVIVASRSTMVSIPVRFVNVMNMGCDNHNKIILKLFFWYVFVVSIGIIFMQSLCTALIIVYLSQNACVTWYVTLKVRLKLRASRTAARGASL